MIARLCAPYVEATVASVEKTATVALHARHGFQPVGTFRDVGGKLGAWRDVAWYHLPLLAPPVAPREPQPWDGTLRG